MTNHNKLSGNVALIVGASSELGLAVAKRLAAEGCGLHLADANETVLEEVVEALGLDDDNEPETHPTDLSDAINAAALALECEEANILVNTVPSPPAGTIDDLDVMDWQQAFNETILTAINLTGEVYESMQEIGTGMIFNIGCSGQPGGQPGSLCQDTVNAALRTFSEALDREASLCGVRVFFRLPSPEQAPDILAEEVVTRILGHQAS